MQVEAAIEADLAEFELAHLAFLHAIGGPVQRVFGADVDDELVGQAIDFDRIHPHACRLAQAGQLFTVGLGFAGIGAVVLERLDTAQLGLEQGAVVVFSAVVLHLGLREGR
ncbi:hypothetical protein D3C71_1760600 [compost metagenome]